MALTMRSSIAQTHNWATESFEVVVVIAKLLLKFSVIYMPPTTLPALNRCNVAKKAVKNIKGLIAFFLLTMFSAARP